MSPFPFHLFRFCTNLFWLRGRGRGGNGKAVIAASCRLGDRVAGSVPWISLHDRGLLALPSEPRICSSQIC